MLTLSKAYYADRAPRPAVTFESKGNALTAVDRLRACSGQRHAFLICFRFCPVYGAVEGSMDPTASNNMLFQ